MTDLLQTLLSTGSEDDYLVALDLCEQEGLVLDLVLLSPETWFHRRVISSSNERRSWVATNADFGGYTMRSQLHYNTNNNANSICSYPDWRPDGRYRYSDRHSEWA